LYKAWIQFTYFALWQLANIVFLLFQSFPLLCGLIEFYDICVMYADKPFKQLRKISYSKIRSLLEIALKHIYTDAPRIHKQHDSSRNTTDTHNSLTILNLIHVVELNCSSVWPARTCNNTIHTTLYKWCM